MTKFGVHYWNNGVTGKVEVEANTPDEAKTAFKRKYKSAEVTKVKRVRS